MLRKTHHRDTEVAQRKPELTVLSFPRFDRGKLDDESCEFSFLAFYLDRAAEIANDAEADTQTQASASRFTARREKRIEYLTQIFTFNPDTVVIELNAHDFADATRS